MNELNSINDDLSKELISRFKTLNYMLERMQKRSIDRLKWVEIGFLAKYHIQLACNQKKYIQKKQKNSLTKYF